MAPVPRSGTRTTKWHDPPIRIVSPQGRPALVGLDDNDQPTYKAKGAQYMKFGVRIWPEVLPTLGLDPAQLKPGPNPISLKLVALMGEKGPRKVIALAK